MSDLIKIKKLALDVYEGKVTEYSQEEGEEALRQAFIDIIGCEPGDKRYRRQFNKHKDDFFEIVEEILEVTVNRIVMDSFSQFTNVVNTELGVKPRFEVENTDLFKVSMVATGLNTLRRQRLYNHKVDTEGFRMGIAIYDEFFDFTTGKRDWVKTINKVALSWEHEIAQLVSKALFGAYNYVNEKGFAVADTYTNEALLKLIMKVEGVLGQKCVIYGTASALDNIEGEASDLDKNDRREIGYVKKFKGRECMELPQVYDIVKKDFVIPDNILLVLPAGYKIINLGMEGAPIVLENTDPTTSEDMDVEYSFLQMVHVGIAIAVHFGMFKIQ